MPANSFAGSSSTCCPRASIASAITACSPARTAPRRSRGRANSWVWPRLWPRKRSRLIRRRRRCSPSLARAVAVACSSSRPSSPAASRAIGQRRLTSQSGSTPHERGHHVSHPHRQARFPLVTIRPQRRSTGQIPGGAFNKAIFPESHRHRGSSEPETHQRPPSPDGCALASYVRRQRRDQIAIAPASPSAPHLPRVPSLEAFGRRPPCKPNRRDGPSSETLHKRRHYECSYRRPVRSKSIDMAPDGKTAEFSRVLTPRPWRITDWIADSENARSTAQPARGRQGFGRTTATVGVGLQQKARNYPLLVFAATDPYSRHWPSPSRR